jgi:hypothetical protein
MEKLNMHPDAVKKITWFCKTKCDIYSREEYGDDTGHCTSCRIMFGIATPILEAVAGNRSLINASLVDGWIETENALLRALMPRSRGGDNSGVFYMDKFIAQHLNNVSKAHIISRNNIIYYGNNVGYQWSKLQKANETQARPEVENSA